MKIRPYLPYLIFGVSLTAMCITFAMTLLLLHHAAPPRACTILGCATGMSIRLTGNIPEEFTIELVGKDGTTRKINCPAASEAAIGCSSELILIYDGYKPEEVRITIFWEGGSITEHFRPIYTTLQPNGPDCPPICHHANLTMNVG